MDVTQKNTKKWVQFAIQGTSETKDSIESKLNEFNCLSITITDAHDQPIYEPQPGQTPLWPSIILTGLFEIPDHMHENQKKQWVHQLEAKIKKHLNTNEMVVSVFADEEWVRTCLEDFVPIEIANGLFIVPSWLEPPVAATRVLKLDPGLAFGTGTHPTTFLCLDWLARQPLDSLKDKHIIDYGCGSGILAIGAALLGVGKIVATDIDDQALTATHINAQQNNVAELIECKLPEKLLLEPIFDCIIANILAEPLIGLVKNFVQLLRPHGQICLSGLLEDNVDHIIQAYTPYFTHFEVKTQGEWARITAILKH